jgi:hypothetical protein
LIILILLKFDKNSFKPIKLAVLKILFPVIYKSKVKILIPNAEIGTYVAWISPFNILLHNKEPIAIPTEKTERKRIDKFLKSLISIGSCKFLLLN